VSKLERMQIGGYTVFIVHEKVEVPERTYKVWRWVVTVAIGGWTTDDPNMRPSNVEEARSVIGTWMFMNEIEARAFLLRKLEEVKRFVAIDAALKALGVSPINDDQA